MKLVENLFRATAAVIVVAIFIVVICAADSFSTPFTAIALLLAAYFVWNVLDLGSLFDDSNADGDDLDD